MRSYTREQTLGGRPDPSVPRSVGMEPEAIEDMFRLLAIAKYEERYVIPQAHTEVAGRLMEQQGACGLDFPGGPGNCGAVSKAFDPMGASPFADGDVDLLALLRGRR
jgi:nitrate reductase beta subunit